MWQIFAPMVVGIGLLLALPAGAEENAGSGKDPEGKAIRVVEIAGRLHHVKGEITSDPPIPFDYWGLLAGGKTYSLDLHDKELLGLAERLEGRTVEVIGILAPSSRTIRVTGFHYALVEIRGKLSMTFDVRPPRYHPDAFERSAPRQLAFPSVPPPGKDIFRDYIDAWTITVDAKRYQLTFDSKDLRELASKLNGKPVVVTGTPREYAIHVTGLKAEASATTTEKVTTEVQGQIKRLKIDNLRGDYYECWGLTVNGVTYELDFGGLEDLARLTKDLGGKVVAVTGVLEVIPPCESVMEIWNGRGSKRLWNPGRMIIHITRLTVARTQ
jgi:hypothetical protein